MADDRITELTVSDDTDRQMSRARLMSDLWDLQWRKLLH